MNTTSVTERTEPLPSQVQLLTRPDEVLALAERLSAESMVALDTEFMREDTYFPLLALIQIGVADQIFLVDPVAVPARDVLGALIRALPVSILHSPGEDYGVLLHATGALPATVLDTQVAAAFAGLAPNLGLRELLRQVLDINLEKDQTRSNWLKRPLSSQQLRYAADDVRHLVELQARLQERMVARGQVAWFEDECRRLRVAAASAEPEAQPHWSFRRADELPEAGQRRLYHLLHWREQRARASDKPRNWIAPQALLWALAERSASQASDIETLMSSLAIQGGRRRAESLLQALQHEDPVLQQAFVMAPAQLSGVQKRRYGLLRDAAERRAAELALPVEILAPRRLLEPLLREGRLPQAWQGWRDQALAGVLDGIPA